MFTGVLPHKHGVHSYDMQMNKLDREDTVFGDLPNHEAIAVNANPAIGADYGIDTLFDNYNEEIWLYKHPWLGDESLHPIDWEAAETGLLLKTVDYLKQSVRNGHISKSLANGIYHRFLFNHIHKLPIPKFSDDGASKVVDRSKREVVASDEPFFLFINLLDAHWEYQNLRAYNQDLHNVPNTWKSSQSTEWQILCDRTIDGYENYLQNRRALYGAAIEYLDRVVAQFVEDLIELTEQDTTIIITSDHGENLGLPGEDQMVHHKASLSEGLLHVPFEIINPPDGYDQTEPGLMSQLQLRTLIEGFEAGQTPSVFDERIPAERVGTFSWETFEDLNKRFNLVEDDTEDIYSYLDRAIRVVYDGGKKYEWDSVGNTRQFALEPEKSSHQKIDNSQVTIPGFATDMFNLGIEELVAETRGGKYPAKDDIDVATRNRLEKLGYL